MRGRLIDSIRPSDAVWCSTNPYTQHRQAYSEKCTPWLGMIAGTVQNHFTPQNFRLHWLVPTYCQAAWIPWIGIMNPQFSFCFRHEDLQTPELNLNESQRDLLKFSSRRIGSWESVVHRSRTNLAKRWCAGTSRYSFPRPYLARCGKHGFQFHHNLSQSLQDTPNWPESCMMTRPQIHSKYPQIPHTPPHQTGADQWFVAPRTWRCSPSQQEVLYFFTFHNL